MIVGTEQGRTVLAFPSQHIQHYLSLYSIGVGVGAIVPGFPFYLYKCFSSLFILQICSRSKITISTPVYLGLFYVGSALAVAVTFDLRQSLYMKFSVLISISSSKDRSLLLILNRLIYTLAFTQFPSPIFRFDLSLIYLVIVHLYFLTENLPLILILQFSIDKLKIYQALPNIWASIIILEIDFWLNYHNFLQLLMNFY